MMDLRNRLTVVTGILIASATCISAEIPTTAYGKPSLEGQWDFKTATPLNRRDEHKDKEFFTPEEITRSRMACIPCKPCTSSSEKGSSIPLVAKSKLTLTKWSQVQTMIYQILL